MQKPPDDPAEINRQNREFWVECRKNLEWCLSNPKTLPLAAALLKTQESDNVPVREQRTFEELIEEAVLGLPFISLLANQRLTNAAAQIREAHKETFRQRAQKGGRALKADPLTRDIRAHLCKNPQITNEELFDRWEARAGGDLVESFNRGNGVIVYLEEDGEQQTISFDNLRVRISRERKKLREPVSVSQASETAACISLPPAHSAVGDKDKNEQAESTTRGGQSTTE